MKKLLLTLLFTCHCLAPSDGFSDVRHNDQPHGLGQCHFKQGHFQNGKINFAPKSLKRVPIYLLHNTSEQTVIVDHLSQDPSASAGWSSTLSGEHWSAIISRRKQFDLQCAYSTPGSYQPVPCESVLSVCEVIPAHMPQALQGSFWLAENLPLLELLEKMHQRGFQV